MLLLSGSAATNGAMLLMTSFRGAGIKQVIIPARNMAEVNAEVPESVRKGLKIVTVRRLEEVLAHAFDPPLRLVSAKL